jgi:hypothetical protein
VAGTRVLSVARVRVAAAHETEYLRTLGALADLMRPRGQRIWVFRDAKDPGLFLEFTESPSPVTHRSRASRTSDEMRLEKRLLEIATYESAGDLWTEVPLGADRPSPS